jgi:hypothetical protein
MVTGHIALRTRKTSVGDDRAGTSTANVSISLVLRLTNNRQYMKSSAGFERHHLRKDCLLLLRTDNAIRQIFRAKK